MGWRTRDPARGCTRDRASASASEEARGRIVGPEPRFARDAKAIPLAHDPPASHQAIHLARPLGRPWIDAEVTRARREIDPAGEAQPEHDPLAKEGVRVERLARDRHA